MRPLVTDDISDLRAYERDRDAFRSRIIELKRRRRVAVGPVVSLVFENRDTVRFQVQEMARAERIANDAELQAELDVYNALLPAAGELSATLFVELTDDAALRDWLPRLVGIERAVVLRFADGPDGAVRSEPEAAHAASLSRDEITPAVHYLRFPFRPGQIELLGRGPVVLAVDHPAYQHETPLPDATVAELNADLTS